MRTAIATLCLLVASLAPARGAPDAPPDVTVYAHRGGAGEAPENTLGAFRQSWARYGARGVWLEMDVQLAADGELVVIHDATVDRTTTCSGRVVDLTSLHLSANCDASESFPGWPSREPVPSFENVLREAKSSGWRLLVELKNIPGEPNFDPGGTRAAAELLEDVAAAAFPSRDIAVQSFFPTSLDHVELNSDIGTALLTTSHIAPAPPGAGFYVAENAAYATARGYEISAPDHGAPDLNAQTVSGAQALGRLVVLWTVNTAAGIARARSLGVDGIISDLPGLVFETP